MTVIPGLPGGVYDQDLGSLNSLLVCGVPQLEGQQLAPVGRRSRETVPREPSTKSRAGLDSC